VKRFRVRVDAFGRDVLNMSIERHVFSDPISPLSNLIEAKIEWQLNWLLRAMDVMSHTWARKFACLGNQLHPNMLERLPDGSNENKQAEALDSRSFNHLAWDEDFIHDEVNGTRP